VIRLRIESDIKLDFCDVLLKPKRSTIESRKEISLDRTFRFLSGSAWTGVPIISSNMSSVTTPDSAVAMMKRGMLTCLPKNWNHEYWDHSGTGNFIPSYGLVDEVNYSRNWVCLDVPNGYIESVVRRVKEMRMGYDGIIIAGNVVTAEQTEALILAGADIVKVGIGSGAACSTRIKTGVGMPQLSAVIECADAAHGLGGHIISDGGCTTPGDIAKAFSGGADFVMLGGMLAGHDENAGPCAGCLGSGMQSISDSPVWEVTACIVCHGSGKSHDFYGSSSERGNNETAGGLRSYRASEGWEIRLPARGPLDDTLQDIEGGLRSACSYVGAKTLKALPKCATFVQVYRQNNQSLTDYRI
jgi:GMP reductase